MMTDDIVERCSKRFQVPDNLLHDKMLALAENLCCMPEGMDCLKWNVEELNTPQCLAICQHAAAGRVTYDYHPVIPGVVEVGPSDGLAEWWCEQSKLLEQNENTETDPIDWVKFKDATKRASKQFELTQLLIDTKGWIELSELGELVWQDDTTTTATVAQMIKRANQSLNQINAKVHIRRDGERAIADFF